MAALAPSITVTGNVQGDIIVGDHNFKVNTNYGTIVYKQAAPRIKLRDVIPQPPRAPRGFVGRAKELEQLEKVIAAGEAALVFAPDGMGKTALLKQAANAESAYGMPNGVVLVESVDGRGEALGLDDIIQRLFDALFESEPPLKVNAASARTYLSNTRPLVLLDGFRQGVPPASLTTLLDLFPKGALLLTSALPPLGDDIQPVKLGPLPRAKAVQLLAAKTGMADDSTPQTLDSLDALCELLADVPLALVTAAAAIRENNIPLDSARDALASLAPLPPDPAQAGIERAYALAYSMLSEHERQVLAVAAASPGASLDPQWLRAVTGSLGPVGPAIERLKALGVIHASSPRLRLDPGFRALAYPTADVERAIYERLIAYLKDRLRARALDFEFCADELGNILSSIGWAASKRRWADVIALGRAIDPYLTLHGLWDAWKATLDRMLLAARSSNDRPTEAWVLHQLGTREIGVGLKEQAIDFLRRALDLRRSLGDAIGATFTQHNLHFLILPPPPPDSGTEPPTPGNGSGGASSGGVLSATLPGGIPLGAGLGVAAVIVLLTMVAAVGLYFALPAPPTPSLTAPVGLATPAASAEVGLLSQTSTFTPATAVTTEITAPALTFTFSPTTTATPIPSLTFTPASTDTLTATNTLTATSTPTQTSTPLETIFVNSSADAVDAAPGDNVCQTVSPGQCTLRAAIQEANALAGAQTISLPPGTYILSIPGAGEDAAATGDLDIRGDLTISGSGAAITIIDGNAIDRVFDTNNPGFTVDITSVTIQNGNVTGSVVGGGLWNTGALTIADSILSNNSAGLGGGLYSDAGGSLTISNSTFSGNSATDSTNGLGGGIMVLGAATVTNSVFNNNDATVGGGGIWHGNSGPLTIDKSSFFDNSASLLGGGVYNQGILTVTNSTIYLNTADAGGGIANQGGAVTVTNSTLSGNAATSGGGIFNQSATLTITNSTLSGNGGGLYNLSGATTLRNTIVADSTPGGDCFVSGGSVADGGNNIVEDNTCGFINGADPALGPLTGNGGSTPTHALLSGSPAIDAGNIAACAIAPPNGPGGFDQRGVAHVGLCDIGAYEFP